ncbi:glycoside hydrolase family 79 protein [Collybia nuda]|uniref:Glycoside hydrolase family 79 protein n=1 Tax=Collybia nuda TaxID=64659 RepID=A0A9P5XWT7_9AGAR|nr:glycoside hydrolase family 79 protein [Collybia nuda]
MLVRSLWLFSTLCVVAAKVTVYGQIPLGQTRTPDAPEAGATGTPAPPPLLAAYDETILKPPALPQPAPPTDFTLNLPANGANVQDLSIVHHMGAFFGFSIEMSVITQIIGKNSSHIQVPFLNLMANLQQRAGHINIRLGGNTQDFAHMVDHIDNGHSLDKDHSDPSNPTFTPGVTYTVDLFYMMANISSLVNVKWYLGIPFIDTKDWKLQIAEYGQTILGDNLLGLQAGNEPDYYSAPGHDHRPTNYTEMDYYGEFHDLVTAMDANSNIPVKNMLIGPSLASGPWMPEKVLVDTPYLESFADKLYAITMENYPSNNCFVRFKVGSYVDPQETFHEFLTHNAGLNLVRKYRNTSNLARQLGKPFIMFETNSATCGGLPGISDSFGAALWALDYGFTMAATNFSGALLHIGGQNVYYNPFTAPPTNQTAFNQWTVGSIFYSTLIMAEAFGKSNTSQIVDTTGDREFTPSYSIYENGALARVALFNYNDDPTGAYAIKPKITIDGGKVPLQVKVKYFDATSVSVKTNLTWANQTFGNKFEVDGRLKGDLNIVTVDCDQATNVCAIPVKAPGFALVFFTEPTSTTEDAPSVTFETSAYTKAINTITVDPEVLETSNGISGKERAKMGSTSFGSVNAAEGFGKLVPGIYVLVAMISGAGVVLAALIR